jgi:hypothetical protein
MATAATAPKLVSATIVSLRSLGINEAYIEKFIQENPSALGLGSDLSVIDSQRRQDKGRLDLLLQDGAGERRFELELMLDSLDESHLVRAIEYWDVERRTYPGYDHCAVVVAENITSRFLNVISLFSGSVPMIALQMSAVTVADKNALCFLKVLDSRKLRRDDTSGVAAQPSDRAEWLSYAGAEIVEMVDKCTAWINEVAQEPRALNYNKYFIGLMESGRANNFVHFSPNRGSLWIVVSLDDADSWKEKVDNAGMDFRLKDGENLRIKVTPKTFAENEALIREMLQQAVTEDEKS